ncbi:MAG: hypothetical protein R2744_10150 [Bacteroidales bacterium]
MIKKYLHYNRSQVDTGKEYPFLLDFENIIIVAAPVDNPLVRKSGPSIEVFHKGQALKAEKEYRYIYRVLRK